MLKLNADGSEIVYSTFLGGTEADRGFAIAVNESEATTVAGVTCSPDFPLVEPSQATYAGDLDPLFCGDAFVSRLAPDGSAIEWSTYLGGSAQDSVGATALGGSGETYVAGRTCSTDFPAVDAIQPELADVFTSFCGDAFVTKFDSTEESTAIVWSTYLGSSDFDAANGVALGPSGDLLVVGQSRSGDFPTKDAFQKTYGGGLADAFVTRLDSSGSSIVWSTYLGGDSFDLIDGIVIDPSGDLYVAGSTDSPDFPIVDAFQPDFGGGLSDIFVARLRGDGSGLRWSSYLGGGAGSGGFSDTADGIGIDASGNVYVGGETSALNFPVVRAFQPFYGGGTTDAVIAKIEQPNDPPVARCRDVVVRSGPDCVAEATIDDGSFDPNGDPITLTQEPPEPYPVGVTEVTLVARDTRGAESTCEATVTVFDEQPPEVSLFRSALPGSAVPVPSQVPFSDLFVTSDDSAVVRETVSWDGCIVFDGNTYGDGDGLLTDGEMLPAGPGLICRVALLCGARQWAGPVLSVEAEDCGGNSTAAERVLPGRIVLNPARCGPSPGEARPAPKPVVSGPVPRGRMTD